MIDLTKPITPKQQAVLNLLLDTQDHSSSEILPLCTPSAPRDIIKGLRSTHGLLIHGRGPWRLDPRHVGCDEKANLIATKEAQVKHCMYSTAIAEREVKRLPISQEKKRRSLQELNEAKNN